MIYEYKCDGCERTYDITKPAAQYNSQELCPTSHVTMTRIFNPKIYLYGTSVNESFYSPALGQVVKSNKDLERKAKEKGFEPIGNERPNKHLKVQLDDYE